MSEAALDCRRFIDIVWKLNRVALQIYWPRTFLAPVDVQLSPRSSPSFPSCPTSERRRAETFWKRCDTCLKRGISSENSTYVSPDTKLTLSTDDATRRSGEPTDAPVLWCSAAVRWSDARPFCFETTAGRSVLCSDDEMIWDVQTKETSLQTHKHRERERLVVFGFCRHCLFWAAEDFHSKMLQIHLSEHQKVLNHQSARQ